MIYSNLEKYQNIYTYMHLYYKIAIKKASHLAMLPILILLVLIVLVKFGLSSQASLTFKQNINGF